ncbi:hypothetical protein K445DRAFT_17000 [Daldinia sp. EC12]|nr:hypothetical protein K445DRAFT_17000 [Daldinia sp. EC12]
MSNPPPPTPSFYSAQTPTGYLWPARKSATERPQDTRGSCQFITFYHICGCRSYKDSVYLCSTDTCQHTMSTIVLGELPFACGSYPGQSTACGVEDPAKKEFVREVDTADRLEKLLVLPDCTRADIDALIPPFHCSDWDYEISSRYHRRPSQSSIYSSPQVPSSNGRGINGKSVEVDEVVQRLLSKYETQEDYRESMVERYVEEQQQLNYLETQNMLIDEEARGRSDLPGVGHRWDDVSYPKSPQNDGLPDAACYDETPAGAIMFSFEENTKESPYRHEVGYINPATNIKSVDNTYYGQQPQGNNYVDNTPRLETHITHKYSEDGFSGSDEVTDDFIDFLAEKDKMPQGVNLSVRKLLSYLTGY